MRNHPILTCKSEPSCSLTAVGMISGAKRSSSSESGVNEDIMKLKQKTCSRTTTRESIERG